MITLLGLEPWMRNALCVEVDTDIFFPEKGGTPEPALRVCRLCPVAAECLDYALARNERFGIWGGVTERKRRRLAGLPDFDDSACGTYPKGYGRHKAAGLEPCDMCRAAGAEYNRAYRETGIRTPVDLNT